ncbi:MAG TPA: hypothetical protein VNL77_13710 [Roseiflexaceae bacterium]|nr:hypothetical protein [Roseiflexaceae bacterium]
MKILRYLLIFVPLAFLPEYALHNDLLIFAFSCVALGPLAGLLGEATEELAIHTGLRMGGLLNATLRNAAAGVREPAVRPGDDAVLRLFEWRRWRWRC